jgi:hypothetical protein
VALPAPPGDRCATYAAACIDGAAQSLLHSISLRRLPA